MAVDGLDATGSTRPYLAPAQLAIFVAIAKRPQWWRCRCGSCKLKCKWRCQKRSFCCAFPTYLAYKPRSRPGSPASRCSQRLALVAARIANLLEVSEPLADPFVDPHQAAPAIRFWPSIWQLPLVRSGAERELKSLQLSVYVAIWPATPGKR